MDRDKEKAAAYQLEYRRANAAKLKEAARAYYLANREAIISRVKNYYKENRDAVLENVRAYAKQNAESIALMNKQRRQTDEQRARKNARQRERYALNRELHLEHSRAHHYANREKRLEQKRAWSAANKPKHARYTAARRAAMHRATPAWADEELIEMAYELARHRTDATGIVWEVDHGLPLKGRAVSGLHVEHNLRVVPLRVNRSKSNKFEPGDPPIYKSFFQ